MDLKAKLPNQKLDVAISASPGDLRQFRRLVEAGSGGAAGPGRTHRRAKLDVLLLKVTSRGHPSSRQRRAPEDPCAAARRSRIDFIATFINQTPSGLAGMLESQLNMPVIDQTELTKGYDFELVLPTRVENAAESLRPLSLQLVPGRRSLTYIVVESAEPPHVRSMGFFTLAPPVLPATLVADSPPDQTDFPPEEFQARWNVVFDRIGDHAVAIIQGAPKTNGFLVPRQSNEFYYLCGIETPHAYLILDGKDRKATLVLPARDARLESAEGKVISSSDAELVKQITGVTPSRREEMTEERMRQVDRAPGARDLHAVCTGRRERAEPRRAAAARLGHHADPWDGRAIARGQFPESAQDTVPRSEVAQPHPDPR